VALLKLINVVLPFADEVIEILKTIFVTLQIYKVEETSNSGTLYNPAVEFQI